VYLLTTLSIKKNKKGLDLYAHYVVY